MIDGQPIMTRYASGGMPVWGNRYRTGAFGRLQQLLGMPLAQGFAPLTVEPGRILCLFHYSRSIQR
jgi:hypothetical protein